MKILIVTDKYDRQRNLTNGARVGKALASLGHEVDYASPEVASAKSRGNQLILAFSPLLYRRRVKLVEKIAEKKNSDAKFAIWIFDSCSEIDMPSRSLNRRIKSILPHIDWLITTDHSYPWEHFANRYLHLFQGVDPDEFDYEPSNNHDREFDIIYAGGLWKRYLERNQTIKELAKNFKMVVYCNKGHEFSDCPNITFRNRVYGKAFFDAHQEAKFVFVPRPPSEVEKDYWSNRIYMAGATGTPCIVEYVEGMEKEFNSNEAIFVSGEGSISITKDVISHFLIHPKERQKIGLNARKRILKEYTYVKRVETLMETIFS